tara:strand:+ start:6028 stop:6684 length:657 start_codon:yes stop_codon:yes gene_type:complete
LTQYIPANPGIYVLLVTPQHEPEKQDFSLMSNWCKTTPVVAWCLDGDKCVACGPGYTDVTKNAHGDIFLFPDGQVFDISHETTFPNLAAWIEMQFEVKGPLVFRTEPSGVKAEPPKAAPKPPPGVEPTLRDLGISGRACAPLERLEVTTLLHLAAMDRDDVKKTRGVAIPVLKEMDALLEAHGLSWGMDEWDISAYSGPPETEEAPEEDADEDDEDLL